MASGVVAAVENLHKALVQESLKSQLNQWWRDSNSISVFVSGKTGAGKSTLVNALIGEKVADEGDSLNPETSVVASYRKVIEGVDVTVWDSPGLQDGTNKEEEYLNDIEKNCKGNIDLFLYCVSMKNTRLMSGSRDIEAMCKLTEKLGKEMWKNAVIVLTYANSYIRLVKSEMSDDEEDAEELKETFDKRVTTWSSKIKEHLKSDVGLSVEDIKEIIILPAGRKELPRLLKGERPWMSHFWIESLAATRRSARPALIKMNLKRLNRASDIHSEKEFEDLLRKEHIIIQDKISEVGKEQNMDDRIRKSVGEDISRKTLLAQQWEREICAVLPFVEVLNISVKDYKLPIGTITVLEAWCGSK